MSQTMNRSQANSWGLASTNASRLLSVSSMPSRISFSLQGGLPSKSRSVPSWTTRPPLSSAAPRP
jgi:hypothetical protein